MEMTAVTKKNSKDDESVKAGGWDEPHVKTRWKVFSGPRQVNEPLRIAMSKEAYADLIAHAKESLETEVCGVLVGDVCEDEEGLHLLVQAVIRGTSARQGGAHVTFTQETWNHIHEQRDEHHPKSKILGWYHSHPGFGVDFSEMDLFIQRNFFSGPTQIAFVTDPLGGEEAICVNAPEGIRYVSRFWVDGRERVCRAPDAVVLGSSNAGIGPGDSTQKMLKSVEDRLTQVMQMVDEQRNSHHRFLLFLGTLVALGVIVAVGYLIYHTYTSDYRPPEVQQFVPIPVRIGDHTCLLGVAITKWDVPPQLNAVFLEAARLEREAIEAEKKKKEAEKGASPTATAPAPGGGGPGSGAPSGSGKP
jgi:proteasome lid subunit RPN8/RPN11